MAFIDFELSKLLSLELFELSRHSRLEFPDKRRQAIFVSSSFGIFGALFWEINEERVREILQNPDNHNENHNEPFIVYVHFTSYRTRLI